jgi:hypothetical protein
LEWFSAQAGGHGSTLARLAASARRNIPFAVKWERVVGALLELLIEEGEGVLVGAEASRYLVVEQLVLAFGDECDACPPTPRGHADLPPHLRALALAGARALQHAYNHQFGNWAVVGARSRRTRSQHASPAPPVAGRGARRSRPASASSRSPPSSRPLSPAARSGVANRAAAGGAAAPARAGH